MSVLPNSGTTKKGIYLNFTHACNLSCPYCYFKDSLNSKERPTKERIDHAVDYIFSIPGLDSITLLGGEILIEGDKLIYLLNKLRDGKKHGINIRIGIITNLTQYEPRLKEFSDMIGNIQISVDGYEDLHNETRKFTGGQPSFQKIIENYKLYAADGFAERMHFHGIVSFASIDRVPDSVRQFLKNVPMNGKMTYSLQLDSTFNWNKHIFKVYKFHREVLKIWKEYGRKIVPLPYSNIKKGFSVCSAGTFFLGFDLPNGTIHGCHEMCGTKKDIVGTIDNCWVDDDKINKNIYEMNPAFYHMQFMPKWFFHNFVIKHVNVHACTQHGLNFFNDKFKLPFWVLYMGLGNKICNALFESYFKKNKLRVGGKSDWNKKSEVLTSGNK